MPAHHPPPETEIDREWRTLARKLALAKGFCFIVYFVADERAVGALKARLTDALRARSAHLIEVAIETAAEFAAQSLSRVFEASTLPAFQQTHAAFWIEAFRGAGQLEWDEARREFLMRLNERRSRIEDEIRCPLILLLPANSQREAATFAPDMWHIRVHSAPLHTVSPRLAGAALASGAALDAEPFTLPLAAKAKGEARAWGDLSVDGLPPAVAHWQSMLKGHADVASLWDGFAAADAWLAQGRPDLAQPLAEQVLALARQHVAADEAGSLALRDLSVALGKVGDVASAQGRLDAAAVTYDECLRITRSLLVEAGDALPLRDLSVALVRVGNVANDQGRLDDAARAYDESLDIARRLLQGRGESLAALRDLQVSLIKVGKIAHAQGRLDTAARSYDEGLDIARRMLQIGGESLPALRDLSVSLGTVGDVAQQVGRLDAAARAYAESLQIARRLVREGGESPAAQRDLSVALSRVGDVASAQGRLDTASHAYVESLSIDRRLLREVGESRRMLRDLSVSLNNVGDVATRQARLDDAARFYSESAEITRRLLAEVGDSPHDLRALGVTLTNIGDVASSQGRADDAQRAYMESLEIDRQRVGKNGETPQNLDDLAVSLLRIANLDGADKALRRAAIIEALELRERLVRVYPGLPFYAERLDDARRVAFEVMGDLPTPARFETGSR